MMKRLVLLSLLLAIAFGSNALINEAWRPLTLKVQSETAGPYSSYTQGNIYTYNYELNHDYLLDSLSIYDYQQSVLEGDIIYVGDFLPPFVADFSCTEAAAGYTIRTAWISQGNEKFIREYKKSYAGKWLSDKLFDINGVLRLEKTFIYNSYGELAELNWTQNLARNPNNGTWKSEMSYDLAGRKTQEIRSEYQTGGVWTPRYRIAYTYRDGYFIPAQYDINNSLPYHLSLDWFPMEVFSNWELDRITYYVMTDGNWNLGITRDYFDQYFYGPTRLIVSYITTDDVSHLYTLSFNAYGMPLDYTDAIFSEETTTSHSVTYTWEDMGFVDIEDLLAPTVPMSLVAYPNPFRDRIKLFVAQKTARPTELAIYNLRGQLVNKWSVKGQNLEWDGKDSHGKEVGAGVYLVRAIGKEDFVTKKIIRLH